MRVCACLKHQQGLETYRLGLDASLFGCIPLSLFQVTEEKAKCNILKQYHMNKCVAVLNITFWPESRGQRIQSIKLEQSLWAKWQWFPAVSEIWKCFCSVWSFFSWRDSRRPWSSWRPPQYLPSLITAHLWQPEHLSGPPTALASLHFLLQPTCMLLTMDTCTVFLFVLLGAIECGLGVWVMDGKICSLGLA